MFVNNTTVDQSVVYVCINKHTHRITCERPFFSKQLIVLVCHECFTIFLERHNLKKFMNHGREICDSQTYSENDVSRMFAYLLVRTEIRNIEFQLFQSHALKLRNTGSDYSPAVDHRTLLPDQKACNNFRMKFQHERQQALLNMLCSRGSQTGVCR